MTLIRQYSIESKSDTVSEMLAFLARLAAMTGAIEGCLRVEIQQSVSDKTKFQYAEYWRSEEDRTNGGAKLGREAFAPLANLAIGKPSAQELRLLA